MNSNMTTEQFRQEICKSGLDYTGPLLGDGELHRFKADGDSKANYWYVLHTDNRAAGVFGCWKRGFQRKWRDAHRSLFSKDSSTLVGDPTVFSRNNERKEGVTRAQELGDFSKNPTHGVQGQIPGQDLVTPARHLRARRSCTLPLEVGACG